MTCKEINKMLLFFFSQASFLPQNASRITYYYEKNGHKFSFDDITSFIYLFIYAGIHSLHIEYLMYTRTLENFVSVFAFGLFLKSVKKDRLSSWTHVTPGAMCPKFYSVTCTWFYDPENVTNVP